MSEPGRPADHRTEARRALAAGQPETAMVHALLAMADDLREIRSDLRDLRRQSARRG